MGLEKKYIDAALETKALSREKAQRLKAEADAQLRIKVPRIAEIEARLFSLGAEFTRIFLTGDTARISEIERESSALSFEKQELEANYKKPEDICFCKICGDLGYKDGHICECVKEQAALLNIEDISRTAPILNCTFDTFDLSLYPETSQKRMSGILKFAKEYSENFGANSGNILFLGNTGLGKTHISLAIANVVIKKGFGTVYGSAQNLFGEVETEYFSYSGSDEKLRRLLDTDLLIIDDLGVEFSTQFIQSVFYNVINTRLNANKPTVISTNLEIDELEKRYTPRIVSRFIGSYEMKKFTGDDIRQKKALKSKTK